MRHLLYTFLVTAISFSFLQAKELDFQQSRHDLTPAQREAVEQRFSEIYPNQKADIESYARIESIEVVELSDVQVAEKREKNLGQIIMVVDKLIGLGKKIWPIIEAGKPVSTTNFNEAISVLPQVEGDQGTIPFYEMTGWRAPRQKSFKVNFRNGWGVDVISFTYHVSFQSGGQYEGKGEYLTGVDVAASEISVSWGFKFNADSMLVGISNMGSQDEPIASATLKISYQASSILRDIQSTQSFHVSGDGNVEQLY